MSVYPAAQCRCVPVNSDVLPYHLPLKPMNDETLVSRYKRKIENNKVFAFLAATTLIVSAVVTAISGAKSFYAYFVPPSVEEQASALAKKGCILFLPDSSVPESTEKFILDAYKEFWRKSDIYYATRIELYGITHLRGNSSYNIAVGRRKADSAASMLIEKASLVQEQTEIVKSSYGEAQPLERAGEYECGVVVRVFHAE